MKFRLNDLPWLLTIIPILYMWWCVVDITQPVASIHPIKAAAMRGEVELRNFNLPRDPISIKADEDLRVYYLVERYKSYFSTFVRIVNADGVTHYVYSSSRSQQAGTKDVVAADYNIPNSIHQGCNNNVTSRTTYTYKYNMITWLLPTTGELEPLDFCVEQ